MGINIPLVSNFINAHVFQHFILDFSQQYCSTPFAHPGFRHWDKHEIYEVTVSLHIVSASKDIPTKLFKNFFSTEIISQQYLSAGKRLETIF